MDEFINSNSFHSILMTSACETFNQKKKPRAKNKQNKIKLYKNSNRKCVFVYRH